MKKLGLFISLAFVCIRPGFALSGYFADCPNFVTVGGVFYEVGSCSSTSAPMFHNTNLGTVTALSLTYVEVQTYENGTDDVNSATLRYRIWTGTPSGSFNGLPLSTLQLGGGGNEKRSINTNLNLLSGLMGSTTYTLEIYFEAPFTYSGGGGIHYYSNSSANYHLTFTTSAALPVSFTSFTAGAKGEAVQLDWRTASERNNSHFEVERSGDSRNWTTIGRVAGSGDSDRELYYSFLDPAPQAGLNYYRLRQVDFDGQYDYSALVQLYLEQPHKLSASPNPSAAQLRLSWPAELPQGSLSIYALDGRRLYQWTLAAGQLEQNLEAAQLPPGVYLARLCDPAGSELDVIKLWKQ